LEEIFKGVLKVVFKGIFEVIDLMVGVGIFEI
jgi:hypothetical protein